MRRIVIIAILWTLLAFVPAWAFNYDQYEKIDLDAVLEDTTWVNHEGPDATAMTLLEPRKVQFEVTLKTQAYTCPDGALKMVFNMLGVPKEVVDALQLGHCVEVTSAKGQSVKFYIQGMLVQPLLEEVQVGEPVLLFCDYLFWSDGAPGMMVSEFWAQDNTQP